MFAFDILDKEMLVAYIVFEILNKDMKKVILTNNIKIRRTSQIITVVVKATHPTCSEIPGITVAVSTNLEGRGVVLHINKRR